MLTEIDKIKERPDLYLVIPDMMVDCLTSFINNELTAPEKVKIIVSDQLNLEKTMYYQMAHSYLKNAPNKDKVDPCPRLTLKQAEKRITDFCEGNELQ